jgi:hypothetical protein
LQIKTGAILSNPISADQDWTEDVDHSVDITEEIDQAIGNAEIDQSSLEEGLTLLQEVDSNQSWPTSIRSDVIMDIWHAMACIKVPKEHGFRRTICTCLT